MQAEDKRIPWATLKTTRPSQQPTCPPSTCRRIKSQSQSQSPALKALDRKGRAANILSGAALSPSGSTELCQLPPGCQGCQAGSTTPGTHLPGAWQVKTSLTFVHTCSRRNDSMLWLQPLREEAGGKLDLS